MKRAILITALAAATLLPDARADFFGSGSNRFEIDFVGIGNPGNAPDDPVVIDGAGTMLAFGAVDYHYRIGKFEVTIDQFMKARAADDRIGNGNENYWNDGTRTVGAAAPASYTSWHEAARFCNWLSSGDAHTGVYQYDASGTLLAVDRSYRNGSGLAYVLPTEDEWYKAAYFDASGTGGYSLFAHGADTAPLRGTNGWNYSLGAGNYVNPPPNYMWQAGTGGMEQNGTSDMMGNVREWNESADDGTLDNMDEGRVIRGGGGFTYTANLDSTKSRGGGGPLYETLDFGFRVAAIPEPGSVGLLGIGSAILLFTRRHRRKKTSEPHRVHRAKPCACDLFDPPSKFSP